MICISMLNLIQINIELIQIYPDDNFTNPSHHFKWIIHMNESIKIGLQLGYDMVIRICKLVGGWYTYPSEKYKFVS